MHRMIAVLLGLLVANAAFAADPFEGTNWKIKATATDGGKDFDDVLHFKGGQFTDDELAKKGFKPATVDEDTRRFGPATFDVKADSTDSGNAKWNGTITANEMTGTLVLTKADGSALNYTFSGEKK